MKRPRGAKIVCTHIHRYFPAHQVICRTGIQGRLGKCPSCSAWFTLDGETVVSAREAVGTCRCCLQDKELTDVARQLCEGCLLGQTFAFRYECSRCHRIQRIPHPMWRYQESPTQPGTVTWACHVGCGDYTRWCIVPEDAARCPPELCPESWGRREEWLEAVRERRRIEAARDPPPRPDEERGGASQCTTM
jgi:hypothetical protein